MHALGDAELVQAMRDGHTSAWTEFHDRFRPLLEIAAERCGVPPGDVDDCVTEVLDDEAIRLAVTGETLPRNLTGYLLRAVRLHHRARRRATVRRTRWHRAAATELGGGGEGEAVIASLCSADLLRSVRPPDDYGANEPAAHAMVAERRGRPPSRPGTALGRWMAMLTRELTDLEWQLLGWASEQVPRRDMAAWLDADYEATKRRVTRLVTRLRTRALDRLRELPEADRAELAALLRRAGIAPTSAVPDDPTMAAGGRVPAGEGRGGSSDDA